MINLYITKYCPFCHKVLDAFKKMDLKEDEDFIIVNAAEKRDELISLGGKMQVPFIIDGETKMYESDDIIAYARDKFKKN